jgi:hypothetical protein
VRTHRIEITGDVVRKTYVSWADGEALGSEPDW